MVPLDQPTSPSYHQTRYRSRRCRHRRSHSGSGSYSSGGGSNTNSPSGERRGMADSETQTERMELSEADTSPNNEVMSTFKISRTRESVSELSDTTPSSDRNWCDKSNNHMCTSAGSSMSSDECRDKTPISEKRIPCLPPTPEETEDSNRNCMKSNNENTNGNNETLHDIPQVHATNNMPVIDEETAKLEMPRRMSPPMPIISRRQMRSAPICHRRHPTRIQVHFSSVKMILMASSRH